MKKHKYIKNDTGFSKSSLSDLLVSKHRTKCKKKRIALSSKLWKWETF